jgi:hypothetical protein
MDVAEVKTSFTQTGLMLSSKMLCCSRSYFLASTNTIDRIQFLNVVSSCVASFHPVTLQSVAFYVSDAGKLNIISLVAKAKKYTFHQIIYFVRILILFFYRFLF